MARPACDKNILRAIEQLIGKNPRWKAPRIREELFLKFGKQTPSSSYIRNKLKAIRDAGGKESLLDRPWSLASVTEHPIPYEILPWLNWLADNSRKHGDHITIREALWIGRLSVIPSKDKDNNDRPNETVKQRESRLNRYLSRLIETSHRYRAFEKRCERIGEIPANSSEFDGDSLEQILKNFDHYFYSDEYSVTPLPPIREEIVQAWIRLSKDGVIPR